MAFREDMTVDEIQQEIEQQGAEARALELRQAAEARAQDQRKREERRAQEAAQRLRREAAVRVEAEGRMREEIKREFFYSHPAATADDFERLYPQLRDQYMLGQRDDVLAATRAMPRYNI
jgi:hypothetical protein